MKNLSDPAIAKYRMAGEDRRRLVEDGDRAWGGAFLVPHRDRSGFVVMLLVLASRGDRDDKDENNRWDHVSVSHNDRCPTWEEMDFVKRLFFQPDEVAMQLHVGMNDHVNNHPYCLHIWRHVSVAIPQPPAILVGVPRGQVAR